jgi:protein-tyrosine-phosphatase
MLPAVANKTFCLDVHADIDDPIGKGMEAYLNCARRIHDLVRLRFDELNLKAA